MTLEVLTMGRVSVDLYPEQTGVTVSYSPSAMCKSVPQMPAPATSSTT